MKPIYKITQHTEEQFDTLIFDTLFIWCDLYAGGCPRKMQILIANRKINNWFNYEVKKLIQQFRKELQPFESEKNITTKDCRKLFAMTISQIFDKYPSALMTPCKEEVVKKEFNNN